MTAGWMGGRPKMDGGIMDRWIAQMDERMDTKKVG